MNARYHFIYLLFFLWSVSCAQESNDKQHLWQPFYINQRSGDQHIDLSDNWQLNYTEKPVDDLSQLPKDDWFGVSSPTSVQWALYKAGKLPHPYVGMNSKKYEWAETAIWYYKKDFEVPKEAQGNFVFLNFDGIDYFARIWLNGQFIGDHQGMFGGPVTEVSKLLNYNGKNHLVIEVKSANFNNQDTFRPRDPGNIVKPWEFTGGTGAEPWFTLGMWRGVRVEIVPKIHLQRPYIVTNEIQEHQAVLHFESEVFVDDQSLNYQLHPWKGEQLNAYPKTTPTPDVGVLKVKIDFSLEGKSVYYQEFPVQVINTRNWVNGKINIRDPKLWWPNGLGDPNIYLVTVSLVRSNRTIDQISFDYGIRKVDLLPTPGPRYHDRWRNWQFEVNGEKFFVKGANWMPADVLLDLPKEKYDWLIGLAKDAGIQIFRIWGSGILETKDFYNACNKAGIMVWQDFPIANYDTPKWPQDVWEAQVVQNIFRLRNEPSLVFWVGGNEFNPYSEGNAASIGILERNLNIFDPSRPFNRTSPDDGGIHAYPDFDPTWYTKVYPWAPFVSETGMHSIPEAAGLYEIVDKNEFKDLGNMYSDEFVKNHPEFIHHFVEFNPARVPRMLSRASHIDNMANPSLESISEASQIGAGEFYQVMSEKLQSNYPVTVGVMPWVFKRPWPVVAAIHLVDGNGLPSAPYYFLKRTYENVHVMLDIERLLWRSGETFPVRIKVLNLENGIALDHGCKVRVTIYDDQFKPIYERKADMDIALNPSVLQKLFDNFRIPDKYKSRYFFITADLLENNDSLLSRSVYWPRTIPQMEDSAFYNKYVSTPVEWPTLNHGPWLKPTVTKGKTNLRMDLIDKKLTENGAYCKVKISNRGKIPAFMTKIDVEGAKRIFVAEDNFFWLAPSEERELWIKIQWREETSLQKKITLEAWNAKPVSVEF